MISQIIEVPVGSTIGDAVEPGELEGHIERNDSVVVDLHKAAVMVRDKARNAEEERLQKLKRKRGHDGGYRDSTSADASADFGRTASTLPPYFLHNNSGVPSRLTQIREMFKASKKKQANGEFTGDASDDGEEDDSIYTTYAGVLDDADYNRDEEIGDYKTGYSLAGGVEVRHFV